MEKAPIPDNKKLFAKAVFLLARECGKELDEELLKFYVRAVTPYGFEKATEAIHYVLLSRRTNAPFPSPRDIVEIIDGDTEDSADSIANRMVGAIAKFGSYDPKGARAYMGEDGWKVIQDSGGWSTLCQTMRSDQTPTYRSQWKKILESELAQKKQQRLLSQARLSLAPAKPPSLKAK